MKIKKLNLKRETIRDLSSSDLDKVAGGKAAPPTYRTCLARTECDDCVTDWCYTVGDLKC